MGVRAAGRKPFAHAALRGREVILMRKDLID